MSILFEEKVIVFIGGIPALTIKDMVPELIRLLKQKIISPDSMCLAEQHQLCAYAKDHGWISESEIAWAFRYHRQQYERDVAAGVIFALPSDDYIMHEARYRLAIKALHLRVHRRSIILCPETNRDKAGNQVPSLVTSNYCDPIALNVLISGDLRYALAIDEKTIENVVAQYGTPDAKTIVRLGEKSVITTDIIADVMRLHLWELLRSLAAECRCSRYAQDHPVIIKEKETANPKYKITIDIVAAKELIQVFTKQKNKGDVL